MELGMPDAPTIDHYPIPVEHSSKFVGRWVHYQGQKRPWYIYWLDKIDGDKAYLWTSFELNPRIVDVKLLGCTKKDKVILDTWVSETPLELEPVKKVFKKREPSTAKTPPQKQPKAPAKAQNKPRTAAKPQEAPKPQNFTPVAYTPNGAAVPLNKAPRAPRRTFTPPIAGRSALEVVRAAKKAKEANG
jgi:hypothetical protein